MASRWLLIALAVGILASAGCEDEYPADLRYEFHPYPSFNKQANQKELLGEDFDEATRSEIAGYLEPYFGTPRDPKVEISAELQNHPELQLDPAILKQGSRLYRNLCLYCHGIVGDGNGPTGQFLNPKPRDFRQGWFKFRSTVRVSRSSGKPETAFPVTPSRADLLKTIRHGIPTASMPSFQLLNEADLNALVSYVIHLSLRGQVERLIALDINLAEDMDSLVASRVENWLYGGPKSSYRKETFVPPPPPFRFGFGTESEIAQRLARGRALYEGDAACVECHGRDGRSNVLELPTNLTRYNDWGDLNPPRNLTFGAYRGGSRPIDVYYRLRLGIFGSGMPAAPDKVSDEDLWYVVAYVMSLPTMRR